MAKGPWFDAIVSGLGRTGEGFTMTSRARTGPNGEKIVTLSFEDPLRSGGFEVNLGDSATEAEVTESVRRGWQRYIRSHPVTRGVRTGPRESTSR